MTPANADATAGVGGGVDDGGADGGIVGAGAGRVDAVSVVGVGGGGATGKSSPASSLLLMVESVIGALPGQAGSDAHAATTAIDNSGDYAGGGSQARAAPASSRPET